MATLATQSRIAALTASFSVRAPASTGADLGAEQPHALDVGRLAAHVLGAHVDDALEAEQRAGGRRRDAVLAGAGLGDHPRLAHPLREQRLADRVVDLVGAGVGEVLALQVDARGRPARRAARPGRAASGGRRSRAAAASSSARKPASSRAVAQAAAELVERRDQHLGDEAARRRGRSAPRPPPRSRRLRRAGARSRGGGSPTASAEFARAANAAISAWSLTPGLGLDPAGDVDRERVARSRSPRRRCSGSRPPARISGHLGAAPREQLPVEALAGAARAPRRGGRRAGGSRCGRPRRPGCRRRCAPRSALITLHPVRRATSGRTRAPRRRAAGPSSAARPRPRAATSSRLGVDEHADDLELAPERGADLGRDRRVAAARAAARSG